MPTENRSSNTEVVSVPRELTQMAADAIDDLLADGTSAVSAAAWVDVSQQLRALLAQPAEQHQGEPVAMPERLDAPYPHAGYPGGWNACLDEIAKLGPLYTHPAPAGTQGEPLARYSMDQTGCEELNPDGPRVRYDDLNRDPGEVERWKKQAEYNQDTALRWLAELEVLRPEVERLRAQLAERIIVPDGYAVVPIKPTMAMRDACRVAGKLQVWGDMMAAALSASAEPSAPASFQQQVLPWLMECFGAMIAGDREERNHRFLEEALELVQSLGCSAADAHQLVEYVYGRPVGEPPQEVGGVMVTLAALCLANGLDMHQLADTELARVWTKVDQIREKQKSKPQVAPLPGVYPGREPSAPVERDERAKFVAWWTNGVARKVPDTDRDAETGWAAWQARAALERKP